jgi:uncharacterized membrane-anchored protein
MLDILAATQLVEYRVYTNQKVVEHPTLVTVGNIAVPKIGMLGVINGFFRKSKIVGNFKDEDHGALLNFSVKKL